MAVMQYYTKYIPEKLSSVQKVTNKLTSVPFRAAEQSRFGSITKTSLILLSSLPNTSSDQHYYKLLKTCNFKTKQITLKIPLRCFK